MILELKGKIIVIIGASGGIGTEICKRLFEEKAKVIAVYNNKNNCIFSDMVEWHCANVNNPIEIKALCKYVIEKYKTIDVLINCFGISSDDLFLTLKDKEWSKVIETNLTGTFTSCKVFAKEMVKQKHGKIINFASNLANEKGYGVSAYAASKAGIISFTKNAAIEIEKTGVTINAICPGRINTGLNSNSRKKNCDADKSKRNLDNIISFIIYMISDEFEGVTGKVFDLKI